MAIPEHFKQKPINNAPPAARLLGSVQGQLSTGLPPRLSATRRNESEPEQGEPLKIVLLEKLWITMTQTYGHRWTSSFGDCPTPDHAWAKYLSGITGQQIANGLAQLRELENEGWPPSAPHFRQLCLKAPGLPTEEEAWHEALIGTYRHEAVRIAAEATSTFDLRTAEQGDKLLRQRFERNYAIVVRRAQTGQPLEGRIAKGLGNDSARPREQIQLEHSRKEAEQLAQIQGVPSDPQAARAQLLAKLRIRRDAHV